MFKEYPFTVAERFMRYVQIDTESDPGSTSFPSTEKQKDLSRLLAEELRSMGIADAHLDNHGYVFATIPSNSRRNVPVICFCAHVDTSPDSSGRGVKPILHKKYSGADIILPDDPSQIISKKHHPYLEEKIGDDIITASGTTLLGADDKADRHLAAHDADPGSGDDPILHAVRREGERRVRARRDSGHRGDRDAGRAAALVGRVGDAAKVGNFKGSDPLKDATPS